MQQQHTFEFARQKFGQGGFVPPDPQTDSSLLRMAVHRLNHQWTSFRSPDEDQEWTCLYLPTAMQKLLNQSLQLSKLSKQEDISHEYPIPEMPLFSQSNNLDSNNNSFAISCNASFATTEAAHHLVPIKLPEDDSYQTELCLILVHYHHTFDMCFRGIFIVLSSICRLHSSPPTPLAALNNTHRENSLSIFTAWEK